MLLVAPTPDAIASFGAASAAAAHFWMMELSRATAALHELVGPLVALVAGQSCLDVLAAAVDVLWSFWGAAACSSAVCAH